MASGIDDLLFEVLEAGRNTSLLNTLIELFSDFWEKESARQDMRDVGIIMLYKNRGRCSDCGYGDWISLLGPVAKVLPLLSPIDCAKSPDACILEHCMTLVSKI